MMPPIIDDDEYDDCIDRDPDWLDCPILPPDNMLATIRRFGKLDGRSVNLFGALERHPSSSLIQIYLRDNLYRPDSHYIYVTPDPIRYGYAYWHRSRRESPSRPTRLRRAPFSRTPSPGATLRQANEPTTLASPFTHSS